MWDLTDFLSRHTTEDHRALRRAFHTELGLFHPQDESAPPQGTTVAELIVLDRVARARHKEDQRAETIHLAIHAHLNKLQTHRRPTKSDEEYLRNRPITTEQWFTIWREETCHDRGRPDLRSQAQRYFCHQFIQNLEFLSEKERRDTEELLDKANLTLFELIELEDAFRSMHWGASNRIAKSLRERVYRLEAPWTIWVDASYQAAFGSWLATLCKDRFVADLVAQEAPFEAWLKRWREIGPCDERHYLTRVLIAGLEESARTFADWNTLHQLVRGKRVREHAEEMLRNFLLQT